MIPPGFDLYPTLPGWSCVLLDQHAPAWFPHEGGGTDVWPLPEFGRTYLLASSPGRPLAWVSMDTEQLAVMPEEFLREKVAFRLCCLMEKKLR